MPRWGELRAAGWPAPEDPGGDDDAGLDGRDLIRDRLLDEVGWPRQCAGWLTHLHPVLSPGQADLLLAAGGELGDTQAYSATISVGKLGLRSVA